MNATTKANNEFREKVRQEIDAQTAKYQALEKVTSKRIQKYLIDRDDTMFIHSSVFRIYVNTHCDDAGGIFFTMAAFSDGKDELGDYGQRVESRKITDVTELERTMKEISGDMRKWRVLKNGG